MKKEEKLLEQLRAESSGLMPVMPDGLFGTTPRFRTWCKATHEMVERMPDRPVKPFTSGPPNEKANVWEMSRYLERELKALDAYLKSL